MQAQLRDRLRQSPTSTPDRLAVLSRKEDVLEAAVDRKTQTGVVEDLETEQTAVALVLDSAAAFYPDQSQILDCR
jgi:hypothetical protein